MLKSFPGWLAGCVMQVALAQQMSYLKEALPGDGRDIFTLLCIAEFLELNLHYYGGGFPCRGTHQSPAENVIIWSPG